MAADLSQDVKVVNIGYGEPGFEAFVKGNDKGPFWSGELYMDFSKEVFHTALGGPRQGSTMGLLYPSVVSAVFNAESASDTSKSGGDQFNLGGTVVIRGDEVVFTHLQESFADHPDLDAVVAAANGAAGAKL